MPGEKKPGWARPLATPRAREADGVPSVDEVRKESVLILLGIARNSPKDCDRVQAARALIDSTRHIKDHGGLSQATTEELVAILEEYRRERHAAQAGEKQGSVRVQREGGDRSGEAAETGRGNLVQ